MQALDCPLFFFIENRRAGPLVRKSLYGNDLRLIKTLKFRLTKADIYDIMV